MIKMTFRKIILLLYHASILIYVDIYLNKISACEIVLVLKGMLQCVLLLYKFFFLWKWQNIGQTQLKGWWRTEEIQFIRWGKLAAGISKAVGTWGTCSHLSGSGSRQRKGWNQERVVSPHPYLKRPASPSWVPSSSGPTNFPKSTTEVGIKCCKHITEHIACEEPSKPRYCPCYPKHLRLKWSPWFSLQSSWDSYCTWLWAGRLWVQSQLALYRQTLCLPCSRETEVWALSYTHIGSVTAPVHRLLCLGNWNDAVVCAQTETTPCFSLLPYSDMLRVATVLGSR